MSRIDRMTAWTAVPALLFGMAAAPASVPLETGDTGPTEPTLPIEGCADDTTFPDEVHPGGEWRNYGGDDLTNNRAQPAETTIDAGNGGSLQPHFVVDVTAVGGGGIVHGTPVVADGCVYFGTTSGSVFAVNAETGAVAWETQLEVHQGGLLCTGVVGSTPVADGRVFATVSQGGSPYTVALDQVTGEELWRRTMDETPGVYNCASPVVHDGMVLTAFTGDHEQGANRGGFVIYGVETGEELAKTYTTPIEDGTYRGGGIWATAAVDTETGFAYVGTSNPEAGTEEHPNTDAIIKIDFDRDSATFGQILGAMKGNGDRYVAEETPHLPTCTSDPSVNVFVRSALCAQMDLDFGASPQLLKRDGKTLVGALQKSGTYHLGDTETMTKVWSTPTAPPTFYSSGSTAATDGEQIFVAGSPPGQMFSLTAAEGTPQWVAPIGDALHYQGVTYANGLVYTNDAKGYLHVFDADDGTTVLERSIAEDVGAGFMASESSGSVAIARNTVYVATDAYLVAYRPTGSGGTAPGLPELPGAPAAPPAGAAVVAGPQAQAVGYLTPQMVVPQGSSLTFANLDTTIHNVQSAARDANYELLFESTYPNFGGTAEVVGVPDLPPGEYAWVCGIHSGMSGTLIVTD